MSKQLIFIIVLLAISCGAKAQNVADNPIVNDSPLSGLSTHLSFELTTPSGSNGRWSTGGGAALTVSYAYFLNHRWFLSPGIGGFYSTMGTDFIPQYDHIYEGTVKNWGIRVPVLLGCQFKLSPDFRLAIATGPLLNLNLIAKEQASPDFEADPIEPESINLFGNGFHRVDLMWDFYAGLTYKQHYCIGFSAGAGITNVASMTQGQRRLNIRRNNFAIMLSYTF